MRDGEFQLNSSSPSPLTMRKCLLHYITWYVFQAFMITSGRLSTRLIDLTLGENVLFLSFDRSFLIIVSLKTIFLDIYTLWTWARSAVSASHKKVTIALVSRNRDGLQRKIFQILNTSSLKRQIWFYPKNSDFSPPRSDIADMFSTF